MNKEKIKLIYRDKTGKVIKFGEKESLTFNSEEAVSKFLQTVNITKAKEIEIIKTMEGVVVLNEIHSLKKGDLQCLKV